MTLLAFSMLEMFDVKTENLDISYYAQKLFDEEENLKNFKKIQSEKIEESEALEQSHKNYLSLAEDLKTGAYLFKAGLSVMAIENIVEWKQAGKDKKTKFILLSTDPVEKLSEYHGI